MAQVGVGALGGAIAAPFAAGGGAIAATLTNGFAKVSVTVGASALGGAGSGAAQSLTNEIISKRGKSEKVDWM